MWPCVRGRSPRPATSLVVLLQSSTPSCSSRLQSLRRRLLLLRPPSLALFSSALPPIPLLSSSLLVLFRLSPASSSFADHAPDGLASPYFSCYSFRRSSSSSTSSSPPSSSLFQPPLPLWPPPAPPAVLLHLLLRRRLRRPGRALAPDFRAKIAVIRFAGHISLPSSRSYGSDRLVSQKFLACVP